MHQYLVQKPKFLRLHRAQVPIPLHGGFWGGTEGSGRPPGETWGFLQGFEGSLTVDGQCMPLELSVELAALEGSGRVLGVEVPGECGGPWVRWGEPRGSLTDDGKWLPRVFGVEPVDLALQLQDLLGLDGNVGGLALRGGFGGGGSGGSGGVWSISSPAHSFGGMPTHPPPVSPGGSQHISPHPGYPLSPFQALPPLF